MPCVCSSCLVHSTTLGIRHAPKSKAAIHRAYRAVAKAWHPDRFENNQPKRLEAEEHFKRIQVAYRELCEHFDHPQRRLVERDPVHDQPPQTVAARLPTIFFGDAHNCFSGPYFPPAVEKLIIDAALGGRETAVGFVSTSAGGSQKEILSRFMLLTNHRLFIRDEGELMRVLWYSDLGDIEFIDRQAEKSGGTWQRIVDWFADNRRRYTLRIRRRDGTEFFSFIDRPDDRVKKVIYNFLRQMSSESRS